MNQDQKIMMTAYGDLHCLIAELRGVAQITSQLSKLDDEEFVNLEDLFFALMMQQQHLADRFEAVKERLLDAAKAEETAA